MCLKKNVLIIIFYLSNIIKKKLFCSYNYLYFVHGFKLYFNKVSQILKAYATMANVTDLVNACLDYNI